MSYSWIFGSRENDEKIEVHFMACGNLVNWLLRNWIIFSFGLLILLNYCTVSNCVHGTGFWPKMK